MTDVDQITIRDETTFHDGKPTPPPPVDHKLAPTSKHEVDRAVASIGLAQHATSRTIAGHLRDLAKLLDSPDGPLAIKAASFLAARGWPKATLGDGTGSRTTTTSTSVETASIGKVPDDNKPHEIDPGHWDDVDRDLAKLLRLLDLTALHAQSVLTDVLAHADDIDELPAGHGECEACGRFCIPSKDPNDRLRSGYCNACRMAWKRAGSPQRSSWAHERRHQLREGQVGKCELCERPWTSVEETASA